MININMKNIINLKMKSFLLTIPLIPLSFQAEMAKRDVSESYIGDRAKKNSKKSDEISISSSNMITLSTPSLPNERDNAQP